MLSAEGTDFIQNIQSSHQILSLMEDQIYSQVAKDKSISGLDVLTIPAFLSRENSLVYLSREYETTSLS